MRYRTRWWAVYSFVFLASAQIALPLSANLKTQLTTATVLLLAISVYLFATQVGESEEIKRAFLLVVAISWTVEALGVATGWPFGNYDYSDKLQPQLLGVPVIVAIAWFGMALPAYETARFLVRPRVLQWLVGGFLLMAFDLFLDPQMVRAGFWSWQDKGWWQGVPLSNYLGWFAVGVVLMVVLSLVLTSAKPGNRLLVGMYAWMVGMSTLGFLLPFAFDEQTVGIVGGVVTLPLALFALIRKTPPWLASQS